MGLDPETTRHITPVIERMAQRREQLVARAVRTYQEAIPEYADLPAGEILESTNLMTTMLWARIVRGETPSDEEAVAIEDIARRRAAQEIPQESLTRSFQIAGREMLTAFDEDATAIGTPTSVLLAVHDWTWAWANASAGVVARVYRDIAVDRAHRDAAQRSEYLIAALHGRLGSDAATRDAPLFGLETGAHYHPVRARPVHGGDLGALENELLRTTATATRRAALATLAGDVVGFVPRVPTGSEALVAVGRPAPIGDAAQGFADATEAVAIASTFGLAGVVDLVSLGPLTLLSGAQRAAQLMEEHHLAALEAEARSSTELERTVLALIEHDLQFDRAAEALHLHPNTVRYRLGRFRELTDLDLRRTHDLVVAWWLLKRRHPTG